MYIYTSCIEINVTPQESHMCPWIFLAVPPKSPGFAGGDFGAACGASSCGSCGTGAVPKRASLAVLPPWALRGTNHSGNTSYYAATMGIQ